jgi:cell division septal protein FtsQ
MNGPARMDERFRARRREVAAAAVRRRRRIALSLLGMLGLLLAAFALSRSPLFAVDEVAVTGVAGERAAVVAAIAAVAPGERLLSVDRGAIAAEVEALPWVRDVVVSRVPPSTIQVTVTPRDPVVSVALPGSSWLLDAEGVVVGGGAGEGLVRIDAPNAVLPGAGVEVVDVAVRNALAVHLALPGPIRALVASYDAPSDRGLRLLLDQDDIRVRFGLAERVEAKAQVIGLLLEQARAQALLQGADDLGIAELDVRAPDNPVLIPDADA